LREPRNIPRLLVSHVFAYEFEVATLDRVDVAHVLVVPSEHERGHFDAARAMLHSPRFQARERLVEP